VRRYFEYRGLRVTFVRNITDIDDRIIERAAQNGESIQSLTARFTQAMHEDYDRLGILRPTYEPKATEHVPGIIDMIRSLIDKGYAYVASNGDVLYSVSKFAGYGKLSGRELEDLRAGARVAIDEAKRDPADFVLWKRAKPGEPFWPSPWGDGRPGWHIECSAMSYEILGSLTFAVAVRISNFRTMRMRSRSRAPRPAINSRLLMHNGFVNVDDERCRSRSAIFTIRDAHPDVARS
jgi:cysteinyl-tRNA synthetase